MVYYNNYCNNDYDVHENNLLCLDARINGHILLSLNESRLEHFNVSFGFQLAIANIIQDLVCDIPIMCTVLGSIGLVCLINNILQKKSQQSQNREILSSQQQSKSLTSSTATSSMTRQLSSTSSGQPLSKLGKVYACHRNVVLEMMLEHQ